MRVPDVVVKCVAYMGETNPDGTNGNLRASGFFVSVDSTSIPGKKYFFFATAKHVAEGLNGKAYFLVNGRGGGVTTFASHADRWWLHPDDRSVDVAVIPCSIGSDIDVITIPETQFATPDLIADRNIGVGDEVFSTGLFTPAPGASRNMPIVRHGNLAMIPDGRLPTSEGEAEVYLVEARSIGGLSGSPVFVRETVAMKGTLTRDGSAAVMGACGRTFFLGLMQGHWSINASEINNPAIAQDDEGVNLGVALVVPAQKILETINQPGLVELRRLADALCRASPRPQSSELGAQ